MSHARILESLTNILSSSSAQYKKHWFILLFIVIFYKMFTIFIIFM